jgi:uncharacterized membrane protein
LIKLLELLKGQKEILFNFVTKDDGGGDVSSVVVVVATVVDVSPSTVVVVGSVAAVVVSACSLAKQSFKSLLRLPFWTANAFQVRK